MDAILEKLTTAFILLAVFSIIFWKVPDKMPKNNKFPRPPVFADWDTSNYIGDENCRDFSHTQPCYSNHIFTEEDGPDAVTRWRLNLRSPVEMQFPDLIESKDCLANWFASVDTKQVERDWRPFDRLAAITLDYNRLKNSIAEKKRLLCSYSSESSSCTAAK